MNRILCFLRTANPRPNAAQLERDRLNDLLAGSVECFVRDDLSLGFFLSYDIDSTEDIAGAAAHLSTSLKAVILDLSMAVERLEGGCQ